MISYLRMYILDEPSRRTNSIDTIYISGLDNDNASNVGPQKYSHSIDICINSHKKKDPLHIQCHQAILQFDIVTN